MEQTRTQLALEEGKRLAGCVVGALIYSIGINMFVVPAGIYTGGLMGICQVLRTLLVERWHLLPGSFDIAGILYYAVNIPLLLAAWFAVDRRFIARTLLSVSCMTLFLSVIPRTNLLSGDTITSCMVGGVVAGSGTGILLWAGSTSGGLDVMSVMILQKKHNFSIGRIALMINLTLYTCCLFLFDVQTAIYSIVYSVIYAFALDRMHYQNINEEIIVITKEPVEELEKAVFATLHRGVTKITASGGYTGEPVNMLFIVVSKFEIHQLRALIRRYDPHAFVTIKEHTDVYGNFAKKI